ncbi:hypothetical protein D9M68_821750 [compost metagenome]
MLSKLAKAIPAAQPSAWRRPLSNAVRISRKKSGPGDNRAAKWVLATSRNKANMGGSRHDQVPVSAGAPSRVLEETQVAARRKWPGLTPVKRLNVPEKCAWS